MARQPTVRAGDMADSIDIPIVGRPVDKPFSEAAGAFLISVQAAPTTVQAEQAVTFTLHVQADLKNSPVYAPPQRLNLTKVPAFEERFYVDDPGQDTHDAALQSWDFVYRLKPRSTAVDVIPSLPFVYYNPKYGPGSKGFQTPYTDEIPLRVTAPETLPAPPLSVPELFLQVQTGPQLLSQAQSWSLPRPLVLVLLLLAPPLLCSAWYGVWRRCYPDANRLLHQRRSRAAILALKQLQRLPRGDTALRAAHIATSVTSYLHQRFEFPPGELTPAETTAQLRAAGYPQTLSQRAEELFRLCDAARFFPLVSDEQLPTPLAQKLILDLEAHTWESDPS